MPDVGDILAQRYAIVRLLGQGGMGSVFEARHTGTGRRVALKLISKEMASQPSAVARFEAEAKAAGAIESQYIAQVMDVGRDVERDDVSYLVMEYLQGEDVQQLMERIGPLPQDLALRIAGQVCLGLEKAHAYNLVHRDIKPANIFLTERDGDFIVKILDFGIAKLRGTAQSDSTSLTRTGSLIGSPLYMSPEQALGHKDIDHRADLWSLGIVLFGALVGAAPRSDVEALGELIFDICSQPNESVQVRAPWVRPEVAEIVARALELRASDRYQTAGEMLAAIRALLPGGVGIDRSMLVPLGEEERNARPPLFTPAPLSAGGPGAASLRGAPGADPLEIARAIQKAPGRAEAASAGPTDVTVTSAGLDDGAGAGLPTRRSSIGLVAIAVLVALIGGGLAAYRLAPSSAPPGRVQSIAADPASSPQPRATVVVAPPPAATAEATPAAAPSPAIVAPPPPAVATSVAVAVPAPAPVAVLTAAPAAKPAGAHPAKRTPSATPGKPYDPTAEP